MNFNLADAIRALGAMAAFLVANNARPPASYLFATLLPEVPRPDYQAKSGTMTVRALMAGLVGQDSPYPETGFIEVSTFDEATAKIANRSRIPEAALRQLQQLLMQMSFAGQPTNEFVQQEALNFLAKVIIQPHLDTMEWLRGQALATSAIDWTFNGKRLLVDYGVPTANKLTSRTGNDAYGGSASKFWVDVRAIRRLLRGNVRALLVHPDTLDVIRYNAANSLTAVAEGTGSVTFRRVNAQGQFTQDTGDTITLISYGLEGEIYDLANPGQTKKIPFLPTGKLLGVGNNAGTSYIVGAGSTAPPELALGYTHIGPSVEGGGRPGRWAELYTPQNEPWTFEGRGVTNGLPVLEAPDKVVIATTEMPS
jgi:hypothetical protein